MIKLTAEFEWHNKEAVALQCEHISQLILQGYIKGDGWEITGEEESEKVIQIEDEEDEIQEGGDFSGASDIRGEANDR